MAKRSKLFFAFTGDAAGLRNVLIKHFQERLSQIPTPRGDTYEAGLDAGEAGAYREVVEFLKRLVINNDELPPDPTGDVNSSNGSE